MHAFWKASKFGGSGAPELGGLTGDVAGGGCDSDFGGVGALENVTEDSVDVLAPAHPAATPIHATAIKQLTPRTQVTAVTYNE